MIVISFTIIHMMVICSNPLTYFSKPKNHADQPPGYNLGKEGEIFSSFLNPPLTENLHHQNVDLPPTPLLLAPSHPTMDSVSRKDGADHGLHPATLNQNVDLPPTPLLLDSSHPTVISVTSKGGAALGLHPATLDQNVVPLRPFSSSIQATPL